eukprot:Nitzschia sp. Nitz4//scaffold98_size77359//63505//65433//NITZ4_005557-RA/size77359-processed-gene-0.23-mRNA-1//1//CDS//3329560784//3474//frame0
MYFQSEGANAVQVWSGEAYCIRTGGITPSPTTAPTSIPTVVEASVGNSNVTNVVDAFETTQPSLNPGEISTNETIALADFDDIVECNEGEYVWNGECTECPSTIRSVVQPVSMCLLVVGSILMIGSLPPHGSAIVWMGLEYLQMGFHLSLVPDSGAQGIVAYPKIVGSIASLDLDAGFSLQCLTGVSQDLETYWALFLPVGVISFLGVLASIFPVIAGQTSKWVVVALHIWHFNLIQKSMNAIQCNDGSWFCDETRVCSAAGSWGLLMYGIVFPACVLQARFSQTRQQTDFKHWITNLPFSNCWWWPGFWYLRRTVLALLPLVTKTQPSLTLTGALATLMVTEVAQRFARPFQEVPPLWSKWFRCATVDTILQASLIGLAGVSLMALAISSENQTGVMTTNVLALMLWTPTACYGMAAVIYVIIPSLNRETDTEEAKSECSTSTRSSQRNPKFEIKAAPPIMEHPSTREPSLHHNLSLIPRYAYDDMEAGTIASYEEDTHPWQGRRLSGGNEPNGPGNLHHDCEQPSGINSAEPEFDDASTLTDLNTYVEIIPEYPGPTHQHQPVENHGGRSFDDVVPNEADEVEDDDITEIWIDEATGLPVDKESGAWTDVQTGLLVDEANNAKPGKVVAPWMSEFHKRGR